MERAMSIRRRFTSLSLKERLAWFTEKAREKADLLPPGPERDGMLKKASQAETASHLNEWLNSPGLQSPR
jgi:hypothetical protein